MTDSTDPTVRPTQATRAAGHGAPPVLPTDPAAQVGKFIRTTLLGSGGMGEVWQAWDTQLNRWVALKFLKGDDADEIDRFRREAQTAASLSHPNIAAVYEVGDHAGRHFIAMQYVEGLTFKRVPRQDARRLVRLLLDAVRGVSYAHEQGIVHRDIKPENIMVDAKDRVYVMDFGLARAVTGERSVSGSIVGTPAYMAPEQARGERVDARADVWAFGATLYELLTDRAPFKGSSVYEILRKVEEEEPKAPRSIHPDVDADLETIVLKCLEKDRARRYASAADLARDLERWLAGEAISAHRPSVAYRFRKSLARRKGIVLAGSAGLVVALAVAVVLGRQWMRAREDVDALRELGPIWTQVLLAKQDLYKESETPARIVARMRSGIAAIDEYVRRHPEQPHGYYVRARARFYVQDVAEAEADLRHALKFNPDFSPAHALLAQVLLVGGMNKAETGAGLRRNVEEAKVHLDRAMTGDAQARALQTWGLARSPEDDVVDAISRSLYQRHVKGDIAGSLRILQEAEERDPTAEYANMLGNSTNDDAERIRYQTLALKRMPHYARAYFDRASARHTSGDYDGAIEDATRALELHPRFGAAYTNRSLSRFRKGDLAGTVEDATRAIEIEPNDPLAHYNRGIARRESGDYSGAIADFDRCRLIDPMLPGIWEARGVARARKGDLEAALLDFDAAIAERPRAEMYNNRANVHDQLGQTEKALADFESALGLDPDLTEAYINRARMRNMNRDYEGAIRDSTRAIELKPAAVLPWIHRGRAYSFRAEWQRSIDDFTQALLLDPKNAEVLQRRGLSRAHARDLTEADRDFTASLQLDAAVAETHALRGQTRLGLGDVEAAIVDSSRAIELDPKHASAYVVRCEAHFRKGEFDGTIRDATRAMEIDPRHYAAYQLRGMGLANKGDMKGAIADWEKVLEIAPPEWHQRARVQAMLEEARQH